MKNILNTDTRRSNVRQPQLAAAPQPSVTTAEISTIVTSEQESVTSTSTTDPNGNSTPSNDNETESIATFESSNDPREPTDSASEDKQNGENHNRLPPQTPRKRRSPNSFLSDMANSIELAGGKGSFWKRSSQLTDPGAM